MSDTGNAAKSLRERLGGSTEDRLGKALSELLENPLLTGAIGRAFDAREKAAQAQEVAMGALNLPSAADIERLTRRLRAVSHRLEGIEDGVDRLDRALTPRGMEARLEAIETQIATVAEKLDRVLSDAPAARAGAAPASRPAGSSSRRAAGAGGQSRSTAKQARAKQVSAAKAAKAGQATKARKAARSAKGPGASAKSPGARSRASHPAPGKP